MPDDRSPFLIAWLQAGLALFSDASKQPPTLGTAMATGRRALALAALRIADGNVTRAAALLGISRKTFHRSLDDDSALRAGSLWHPAVMNGPFDDLLFPFIRTIWPAVPDATFVEDYGAWMVEHVVPRAVSESTKIVVLENFVQMNSLPPASSLTHLQNLNSTVGPIAGPHGAGAIIYAPNVPIAGWIAPVLNLAPVPFKIATKPDKVVDFATKFFTKAGVAVPPDLSVN